MVNPSEAVELDPEPEDILSGGGKDLTAQNIEQFLGSSGHHGISKPSPDLPESRNNRTSIE